MTVHIAITPIACTLQDEFGGDLRRIEQVLRDALLIHSDLRLVGVEFTTDERVPDAPEPEEENG
jgi:hypothetical protein